MIFIITSRYSRNKFLFDNIIRAVEQMCTSTARNTQSTPSGRPNNALVISVYDLGSLTLHCPRPEELLVCFGITESKAPRSHFDGVTLSFYKSKQLTFDVLIGLWFYSPFNHDGKRWVSSRFILLVLFFFYKRVPS